MKIALVFDDLIQFGGAERLLLAAQEMWPDAPLYTSVASSEWKERCKEYNIDLRTSFLQKFPFIEKLYRFYAPFFFYNIAFENFDFSEYEVVLSISTRFAHTIVTRPETVHICYLNSPGRMFWEPKSYFEFDVIGSSVLTPSLSLLRVGDYTAAQKVDFFIANSVVAQNRIEKYYQRDSEIINPFVNESLFDVDEDGFDEEYYVILTRLLSWKRVDIAIKACSELGVSLKVIGEGPDRSRLESIAKSVNGDVKFLGYVSESRKRKVLAKSLALINTQYEDFGIVPLEAMAVGTPVIAYKAGGVLETVVEGETGVFFEEQTSEALSRVLKNFNNTEYSSEVCTKRAEAFNKENFQARVRGFVNSVYLKSNAK